MYTVEVKNLSKSFTEKGKIVKAVKNISFRVKKGEVFGLLGPNGAGKTTTLNMLNGLLEKDKGSIKILGYDPKDNWEYVKNRMNVATAYFSLSEVLTIRENLKVYGKLYGVKKIDEKINEMLKLFELEHLRNRKVIRLSSGERTRVALCKGFINDPEVLFLDECTVGLDPDIAEKTRMIIKDYQKTHKTTIIFTSHYMYEVEELCKRIAFMDKGRILRTDTAKNFKKLIKKTAVELTVKDKMPTVRKVLKDKNINVMQTGTNTIMFEVESSSDKLFKIMNTIFKAGAKLSDMHVQKPTLDDIFIRIARGKKKR